jgi:hypothetical protein
MARWMRELELIDRNLTFEKSEPLPELADLGPELEAARRLRDELKDF